MNMKLSEDKTVADFVQITIHQCDFNRRLNSFSQKLNTLNNNTYNSHGNHKGIHDNSKFWIVYLIFCQQE